MKYDLFLNKKLKQVLLTDSLFRKIDNLEDPKRDIGYNVESIFSDFIEQNLDIVQIAEMIEYTYKQVEDRSTEPLVIEIEKEVLEKLEKIRLDTEIALFKGHNLNGHLFYNLVLYNYFASSGLDYLASKSDEYWEKNAKAILGE